MNNNLATRLVWVFALVFLVAGSGMTVQNLVNSREIKEQFRKKLGEFKILKGQEADLVRHEMARRKMEQLTEKKPAPLNTIMQEIMSGIKVEDVRDSRKDLKDGWALRQKEVSLSDVPIGRVMELVCKAESQKLPWCLAKCVIRAAPRVAGTGQVVLLLEAVERSE